MGSILHSLVDIVLNCLFNWIDISRGASPKTQMNDTPKPEQVERREYYPMTFYCNSLERIRLDLKPPAKSDLPKAPQQSPIPPKPAPAPAPAPAAKLHPKTIQFAVAFATGIILAALLGLDLILLSIIVLVIVAVAFPLLVLKPTSQSLEDRKDKQVKPEPVKPEPVEPDTPQVERLDLYQQLSNTMLEREGIYDFSLGGSDGERAKKGASEAHFLTYLEQWFSSSWRVKEHCQFSYGGDYVYTADFALFFNDFNLGVDLEIDEPYALGNSLPIHLIEDKKYINRDKFFLSQGFIVIRFAEYQIVKYPDYCCLHIARVLNQFLIDKDKVRAPINNNLKQLPTNEWRVKSWTERESKIMIQSKIRESYLAHLKSNPTLEQD